MVRSKRKGKVKRKEDKCLWCGGRADEDLSWKPDRGLDPWLGRFECRVCHKTSYVVCRKTVGVGERLLGDG